MTNAILSEAAIVTLQPYARLRFDPVRQRHVLLAPERVLFPCPTTVTILERCDGESTLGEVIDGLAEEFEAPREVIARDTTALLGDLLEQRLLKSEPIEMAHG
jgi:coenzyme PQQ biosynthesis protein PqqD